MDIAIACNHGYDDKVENDEGQDVKDRGNRTKPGHKAGNRFCFPDSWFLQEVLIHSVKRQGNTGKIVNQVQDDEMDRSHWKERKENTGKEKREDIPKVGRNGHLDVLGHVGINFASFYQAFFEDHQVLIQKDNVCCFFGNIDSCINRNPHICHFHRRSIVDPISHISDLVAICFQLQDNACFLIWR